MSAVPLPRVLVTRPAPELTLRTVGGSRTYTPADVDRVRIRQLRRIGRRSSQLELEILRDPAVSTVAERTPTDEALPDTALVVLNRWDLGADPYDVAEVLDDAGFVVVTD